MKKILIFVISIMATISCADNSKDFWDQSIAELEAGIEAKHPVAYYILAEKLFSMGKKDEAVKWYYIGQLRFRYHLAANPDLEPSQDPAIFSSFTHVMGAQMNEYAFGDIPKHIEMLDQVLLWDESHDNDFTPKTKAPKVYEEIRAGLIDLKEAILEQQDYIREQRKINGLENRN